MEFPTAYKSPLKEKILVWNKLNLPLVKTKFILREGQRPEHSGHKDLVSLKQKTRQLLPLLKVSSGSGGSMNPRDSILLIRHQPKEKQAEAVVSEGKLAHHHLQEFLKSPWVSKASLSPRPQTLQHPAHLRARTAKATRTCFVVLAFCLSALWWVQCPWLKDTSLKTWAAIFILLYKLFIYFYHLPLALV